MPRMSPRNVVLNYEEIIAQIVAERSSRLAKRYRQIDFDNLKMSIVYMARVINELLNPHHTLLIALYDIKPLEKGRRTLHRLESLIYYSSTRSEIFSIATKTKSGERRRQKE